MLSTMPLPEDPAGPAATPARGRGLLRGRLLHPLLRALGVVGAATMTSQVVGFIAFLLVARRLGPDTFGRLGYAAALTGWIAAVTSLGLYAYGQREVTLRPQDVRQVVGEIVPLSVLLQGLAYLGVVVYSFLWVPNGLDRQLLLVYGAMMFLAALDVRWAFFGMSRAPVVSVLILATNLLYAGVVVALVHGPSRAPLVAWAQLVQNALIVLGLVYFFRRYWSSWEPRVAWSRWKAILKVSVFLGAGAIMTLTYDRFDVVLLQIFRGSTEVGLYTSTYNLMSAGLMAIVTILGVAVLPTIMRAIPIDPAGASRKAERYLQHFFVLAFPVAVGGILLSRQLLVALLGPGYAPGAPVFAVLACNLLFGGMATLFGGCLLLGLRRNRAYLGIVALAAAANVGLNLALMPRYGMIAAAYTTLAAQGVGAAASGWITRKEIPVRWVRFTLRPAGACALMAAVILGVRAAGGALWIEIAAGVISYAGAILALRAIDFRAFLLTREG